MEVSSKLSMSLDDISKSQQQSPTSFPGIRNRSGVRTRTGVTTSTRRQSQNRNAQTGKIRKTRRGAEQRKRGVKSIHMRVGIDSNSNRRKPRQNTERGGAEEPKSKLSDRFNQAPDKSAPMFVSGTSNVRKLAGAIVHNVRDKSISIRTLSSVGNKAVNQAVKAIINARSYLQDDDEPVDLNVSILQGKDEYEGRQFQFELMRANGVKETAWTGKRKKNIDYMELTVVEKTNVKKLAGAIANVIRENKRVRAYGIGPDCVFKMTHAVAIARTYLIEDALDIWIQPEFTHIFDEQTGRESTGIAYICKTIHI